MASETEQVPAYSSGNPDMVESDSITPHETVIDDPLQNMESVVKIEADCIPGQIIKRVRFQEEPTGSHSVSVVEDSENQNQSAVTTGTAQGGDQDSEESGDLAEMCLPQRERCELISLMQPSRRGYGHAFILMRSRWWVLFLVAMLNLVHAEMSLVYTSVSESAEILLGLTTDNLVLFRILYYLSFFVAALPMLWVREKQGTRFALMLSCAFVSMGGIMRLFPKTNHTIGLTLLNISNILVGFGGPIIASLGPGIAQMWFPARERVTAIGLMSITAAAGSMLTLVSGVAVQYPFIENFTNSSHGSADRHAMAKNMTDRSYVGSNAVLSGLAGLRKWELGLVSSVFFLMVCYFPDAPPVPPSMTAVVRRSPVFQSALYLLRKPTKRFWMMCMVFSVSTAMFKEWIVHLSLNLKEGLIAKDVAAACGIGVVAGIILALICCRLVEQYKFHLKTMCVVLVSVVALCFSWLIVILSPYSMPFIKDQFYTCVIGLVSSFVAIVPLYYELAVVALYPIHAMSVALNMNFLAQLLAILAIGVEAIGFTIVTWMLYFAVVLSFFLLILFPEGVNDMISSDATALGSEEDDD